MPTSGLQAPLRLPNPPRHSSSDTSKPHTRRHTTGSKPFGAIRFIAKAAEALSASVRGYDHVARIGGDEFAVLVTGMTSAQIHDLVGRIHAAFDLAGVSGSIGHAPYTIVAGFPGAFAEADAAMYEQKRARRGNPGHRPPTPMASSR